jgi:hypothetical protein
MEVGTEKGPGYGNSRDSEQSLQEQVLVIRRHVKLSELTLRTELIRFYMVQWMAISLCDSRNMTFTHLIYTHYFITFIS